MRRILPILLLIALLVPGGGLAASGGEAGTSNYIYSYWGEVLPVPPAYTLERSFTASNLEGVDSLIGLTDAFVTREQIFIACQTQLIITDHALAVNRVLKEYIDGDKAVAFAGLSGVFVTEAGDYYLAQAEKGQILHFNADDSLRRVLTRPEIVGFETVNYRPTKLAVDSAGRIFVIAKGMYEGIVELRPDGSFSRFYGVNKVMFDISDLIWRVLATDEQRARQQLWLPMDFTNLCIDKDGFIFATVQGELGMPIMRLNAKGENILRVQDEREYPEGDVWTNLTGYGIPTGLSNFIAVDTNDFGVYAALDSKRARVFAYNEDGKLLFILGGLGHLSGDRKGYLRNPVDVDFVEENLLVLDQLSQSIELFSPTDYGRALLHAVSLQHHYDYAAAADAWRAALAYNHNLTLAYTGIGRALLREKRYEEAMVYLEQGGDRVYYDKAFQKVRNENLRQAFVPGVLSLAGLAVLAGVSKRLYRRRRGARKGGETA